jgi:HSP20 family protein
MKDQWLQNRFRHPTEYQGRLLASLVSLPARQQQNGEADWFPAVDILENGEEYLFMVDLPGMTKEMIRVYVENDALSITGERVTTDGIKKRLRIERPSGPFVRHFALPDDASRVEIRVTLRDGVLELHVGKIPPEDGNTNPHHEHFEVRITPSNRK